MNRRVAPNVGEIWDVCGDVVLVLGVHNTFSTYARLLVLKGLDWRTGEVVSYTICDYHERLV